MKKRPKDNDTPNNSMDVRAKQLLFKSLRGYFRLVRRRFCPTSSQSLDASCLKTQSTAYLKSSKHAPRFL